jgi:hypothetical protein
MISTCFACFAILYPAVVTGVVVSNIEKRIAAIAAARGVFIRSRVSGTGCRVLCCMEAPPGPTVSLPFIELRVFALGYQRQSGRNGVIRTRYLRASSFHPTSQQENDHERMCLNEILYQEGKALSIGLWSNISHDRRKR